MPSKKADLYVTARVTIEEKLALAGVADSERRTISQIARFAIQEFLAKRRTQAEKWERSVGLRPKGKKA